MLVRWPAAERLADTIEQLVVTMPGVWGAELRALIVQAGWARAAREAGEARHALALFEGMGEAPLAVHLRPATALDRV